MLRLRDLDTRDEQAGHVSTFFRLRRMNVFRRLVRNLPRPLRILDLGGTFQYWEFLKAADPKEFRVTILNRGSESLDAMDHADFNFRKGDVKDLSWVDRSDFDLIHLNSVIEHLFNAENQQRMASQITSIGLPYWVQTPNYWFPLEPFFIFSDGIGCLGGYGSDGFREDGAEAMARSSIRMKPWKPSMKFDCSRLETCEGFFQEQRSTANASAPSPSRLWLGDGSKNPVRTPGFLQTISWREDRILARRLHS
ncbi:class I SAM-dependent methyltransferase [bacterium]|nr:class I SAM-dependent methyltransferase [bacterium]